MNAIIRKSTIGLLLIGLMTGVLTTNFANAMSPGAVKGFLAVADAAQNLKGQITISEEISLDGRNNTETTQAVNMVDGVDVGNSIQVLLADKATFTMQNSEISIQAGNLVRGADAKGILQLSVVDDVTFVMRDSSRSTQCLNCIAGSN